MKKLIFLLSLLLLFASVTVKAQSEPALQGFRVLKSIPYKTTANNPGINLDIFLPDSILPQKLPVVIIIHGGGWAEGDKSLETIYYMQQLRSELIKNKFAVISIDYRLVGKTIHFPTPIEDCKDAIRWVRAHADEYDFDTSNIGLWGGSAGGHLALLSAYTTDDQFVGDRELSAYSARVNYVVDNFGPTDMNALFKMDIGWFSTFIFKIFFHKLYQLREKLVFATTGYHVKTDKKKIREINSLCSPLTYANEHAVPTIIFHGTKDNVVPISQSEDLKKALDHYSIENELIKVDKGDHGFNNISKEEVKQLVDQSIAFIKNHLK